MTDQSQSMSTKSVFGLAGIAVVAAVIGVSVGIVSSKNGMTLQTTGASSYVHPHFQERKLQMIIESSQGKLAHIRELCKENEALASYLTTIPEYASEILGLDSDESQLPEVRAAAWLAHVDTVKEESLLATRFALATIYHATSGKTWTRSANWLSEKSHCEWEGVTCCKNFLFSPVCADPEADPEGLTELDLYDNNLDGTIPNAVTLLKDVQSLFFSENWLKGEIPGPALSDLPKLLKIYLQHNQLTGTIPSTLYNNEILDTLFVQGNDLGGTWPRELCPPCPTCDGKVSYYGMDCNEVRCSESCCRPWVHCFYHEPRVKPAAV